MSEAIAKIGMKLPHPGASIREEILEALELPVARAAEALGVRRATLSDLIHEKAALLPEMALRVEKAFGVSMDMLLRLQAGYDTKGRTLRLFSPHRPPGKRDVRPRSCEERPKVTPSGQGYESAAMRKRSAEIAVRKYEREKA